MRRLLTLAAAVMALFAASESKAAVHGPGVVCVGATALMYDSTSSGTGCIGGVWSSSNPAVASIGSSTGIVTGVSTGTAVITYVCSAITSTAVISVNPSPSAISGGTSPICVGATTTLTCPTSGGTWFSASSGIASVSSSTGVVTGTGIGTATIHYIVAGCSSQQVVTVNGTPTPDSVTGPGTVCIGSSITLSCITAGGTWSSSSTAMATVSSGGVVTGVSAGTVNITYTVSGPCGSAYRTYPVTVTSTTSPGTISGSTSVATGFTTLLSATVSGGTWSSSTPSVATVSSSGLVTGLAIGTTTISYTVSGCSGLASATTVVTVSAANCISGDVLFSGTPYYGPVMVWLIRFNPTTNMLYAVDSQYVYASGASAGYSFCGMGTDSFRVKAAADSMSTISTGYQPTYHTASPFWSTATVIYHTAGTHDMGKDINMGFGTVTAGPGFIAGDVTTGANKGTADGDPAVGMLIYCVDNATGNIIQKSITDAAGHYTFSSLPVDKSYKIYPEMMNYGTTPYADITLTSAATSMVAAHFEQHTLSHTITPKTSIVTNTPAISTKLAVYPNPAKDVVNIGWTGWNKTTEAELTINDMTGRQVIASNITIAQGTGAASINVSNLAKGIYFITVKSNEATTTSKIKID